MPFPNSGCYRGVPLYMLLYTLFSLAMAIHLIIMYSYTFQDVKYWIIPIVVIYLMLSVVISVLISHIMQLSLLFIVHFFNVACILLISSLNYNELSHIHAHAVYTKNASFSNIQTLYSNTIHKFNICAQPACELRTINFGPGLYWHG